MTTARTSYLINRKLAAILVLGLASGLPLALTGTTLQAWFTEANVNLVTIGALSLLGIPYTLKFLWAPLMDHFAIPRLGKRKGWMLLMQLCVALALLLIAHMQPSTQTTMMGITALAIAFFSASQDVAITAYQTDVLSAKERGLGVAYYIFAYRVAMLMSGGLALVFADYAGWTLTYELMAGLMLLTMLPTWCAPAVSEPEEQSQHFLQTVSAAIRDLMQRDNLLLLLLFVFFYKLGDALALQLMTNFLLHGLGFSLTEVGLAYKTVSFVATILGAFAGGVLLSRWHIYRALLVFGLAQAFSNLTFVLLAMTGKDFLLMASSVFIENFCSGLSTAALFAFLMSLCNQRYSASQFALLSAIASLGRVFLGPVAGVMVEYVGWVHFYLWSFMMCFPGILLLLLSKKSVMTYVAAVE